MAIFVAYRARNLQDIPSQHSDMIHSYLRAALAISGYQANRPQQPASFFSPAHLAHIQIGM